jgi:hypothetical protein
VTRFASLDLEQVPALLRAEPATLRDWLERQRPSLAAFCVFTIVLGAGIYGGVMGCWRSPLQALFTGIKLPLLILLTTLGNALLNAMLAPLLGLNLSSRQCLTVILMTFAIAAVMLGSLAPVAAFVVWNTPPLTAATTLASPEYGLMQLTLFAFIAGAGVTGNVALAPLLREWSGSAGVARRVLCAWVAVNLLLGSQICWVLRPFIWDPAGPVQFIGQQYLHGSFFETVFEAARRLLFP